MADALGLIAIGVATILWGARGFFGTLFIVAGLVFIRHFGLRRYPKVRRALPGKSLVVSIEGEERIKVAVPLSLLSVLAPILSAGAPFLGFAPKDKVKIGGKELNLKEVLVPLASALNGIVDVLSEFEGEIVHIESSEESVRIYIT